MHSDILEDEERFRQIIDEAIKNDEVKAYKKYTGETKSSKAARKRGAQKESKEAEELAKELKVDKLINGSEEQLGELIRKRNASRTNNFLDNLERKYSTDKPKKSKKSEIPSEEEFDRLQSKLRKKTKR